MYPAFQGDPDERRSVLSAMRDQSRGMGARSMQPFDEWTPQQWWQGFNYLFAQSAGGAGGAHGDGHGADDLLFFVARGAAALPPEQAYFVRRKGAQLPSDLQLSGAEFDKVDWAQSVMLNLVLHSQYSLTVVACGRDALPFVAEGRTWTPDMRAVTKPVYASPTVLAVNLDCSRAGDAMPVPSYPDICFAVDNFANAFDDLVLQHLDDCYCVVLHALLDAPGPTGTPPSGAGPHGMGEALAALGVRDRGGEAGPHTPTPTADAHSGAVEAKGLGLGGAGSSGGVPAGSAQHGASGLPAISTSHSAATTPTAVHSGGGGSVQSSPSGWQIGTRKRTLFAGYVSFEQILTFVDANQRGFSLPFLQGARGGPHKDKIIMTGPGGTGRAEVAVTKLPRPRLPVPSSSDGGASGGGTAGPQPSSGGGSEGGLFSRGVFRARQLATGLQKAIADSDGEPHLSMQCALMLLKLPMGYLAQELLEAV